MAHNLEREYFELRIQQEQALAEFKAKQKKEKGKLTKTLSKASRVSKARVQHAISLMKSMTALPIADQTAETYKLIMSNLDVSFQKHYEEGRDIICEYVSETYRLQRELESFRKDKKKTFNAFKAKLKEHGLDASLLNHAYLEYKNAARYIADEGISLDEYQNRKEQYNYLNEIVDDFLQYECQRIEKKRREKKNLEQQEELYMQAIADMFGKSAKSTTESYVESILLDIMVDEL